MFTISKWTSSRLHSLSRGLQSLANNHIYPCPCLPSWVLLQRQCPKLSRAGALEDFGKRWAVGRTEDQKIRIGTISLQASGDELETRAARERAMEGPADCSKRCAMGCTKDQKSRIATSSLQASGAEIEKPGSAIIMEAPAAGLARELWEANRKEAYCALYHPFVVTLATGTLQMDAFLEYIAQDVHFLGAFAESYGLAIENCEEEEARAILRCLKRGVQDELDQVHLSSAAAMDLADHEPPASATHGHPNPATAAYSEFLLGVARGDPKAVATRNSAIASSSREELVVDEDVPLRQGDPKTFRNSAMIASSDPEEFLQGEFGEASLTSRRKMGRIAAHTLVAMTPCSRLYAFLGHQIHAILKENGLQPHHAYSHWIEAYASKEFLSTATQSEELLHRFASPYPGKADRETVEKLYGRAMELEVGFFAAQRVALHSNPETRPRAIPVPLFLPQIAFASHFIFVSDFDSTCTVSDSCPAIADLSVSTAGKYHRLGQALRGKWDSLIDQYAEEYSQLLERALSAEAIGAACKGYSAGRLRKVVEQLAEFDIDFNGRVVDSGVLEGLNAEDVKQAGGSVPLRDGCKDLLGRISQNTLPLDFHVLSVCWSGLFIQGSFLQVGLDFPNIHSNELQFDFGGRSTGNILRTVQTGVDKETVFLDILKRRQENLGPSKRAFSVYVGDSVTDLLCLLTADIGLVIGESRSLNRVAEACGITFLPLHAGVVMQQQVGQPAQGQKELGTWTKVDGVLYRISSWDELHAFLLGS